MMADSEKPHGKEANREKLPSIRDEYAEHGASKYYAEFGSTYRNPHEDAIRSTLASCCREWNLDLSHVLDLACGSGEATLELRDLGAKQIDGADPYTAAAYRLRTGKDALKISFEQIAAGKLTGQLYSLIVCSYALHLPASSRLPELLVQLSLLSPALLILSPHKRPEIKDTWRWKLREEMYRHRVRARLFSSEAEG